MKKCNRCGARVPNNPLSLFEHTLLRHTAELLRNPRRLLAVTQNPDVKRMLTEELLKRAVARFAGELLPRERK